MTNKTVEKKNLNDVSSLYHPGAAAELENTLILNWYPKRIMRRIGNQEKSSLLELGVGHGYTAQLFSEHFTRHVILEGSSDVIELFNSRNKSDIEIIHTYFEEFDTEEKFDIILMGFILEHVDDPGLILNKFKKMLAPNGRIFIAVPNAKSLNRRYGLELGMIDDIYDLNEKDIAFGHQRQFCRDTLTDLMKSCGYSVAWEEGIYLKPLPLGHLESLPRFQDNLQAMLEVGVDFPDLCVALLMEVTLDE